jgi:Flp pilus assembly pilin Flp
MVMQVARLLIRNQKGQDLIEYALLVGFMAVIAAGVMPHYIGDSVSTIFSKVNVKLVALSGR